MAGVGLSRHMLLQDYRAGKERARAAQHDRARDLLGYQHELGADDRTFRQQQHEDTHGLNVDKFGFEQQKHGDEFGFEQQQHGDAMGMARDRLGFEQSQHQDAYGLAREKFGHESDMGTWGMQLKSAQAGMGEYQKTIDPETGEESWTHRPGVLIGQDFRPTPGPNQFLPPGGGKGSLSWQSMLGRQEEEAAAASPQAMGGQTPSAASDALNAPPIAPIAPEQPKKPRFEESEAFLNRFYRDKMKPFAREALNQPFTRPHMR